MKKEIKAVKAAVAALAVRVVQAAEAAADKAEAVPAAVKADHQAAAVDKAVHRAAVVEAAALAAAAVKAAVAEAAVRVDLVPAVPVPGALAVLVLAAPVAAEVAEVKFSDLYSKIKINEKPICKGWLFIFVRTLMLFEMFRLIQASIKISIYLDKKNGFD